MTSPVQQFIELVKTIPNSNTLDYLHDVLGKQGVKVIYDKNTDSARETLFNRLMFGTFSRSCSFGFPGVILSPSQDGLSFKAVSVPPSPPVTQYQSKFLHDNSDKYSVINANDGTTVTLYYFNDKWAISTHRGFEVNSYVLVGSKTYEDIINEVLKFYPEFSYDALDKRKCYTFGFNHSEFHPFREVKTPENAVRAWFIQSCDLDKFNASDPSYLSYTDDIGLPMQEEVIIQLKQMFQHANNAYNDYIENGTVNYGYLVRIENKQYLVESSLLKNIRHIFYTNKFAQLPDTFDKQKYIVANAFLDSEKHNTFKALFSQYRLDFIEMEKQIDSLIQTIMTITNVIKSGNTFTPKNVVEVVSYELYHQVLKYVTLDSRSKKELLGLLYSFIYNTKFTALLYKLVYKD